MTVIHPTPLSFGTRSKSTKEAAQSLQRVMKDMTRPRRNYRPVDDGSEKPGMFSNPGDADAKRGALEQQTRDLKTGKPDN
ncbi:MAG: hypothetical protein KTR14_11035 [Vampirovibrio sp.]|nr:hypothetical protein [Vampirovibrio sp.]